MKWSIVGLVAVGLVAAISAALLTVMLRGGGGGGSREVDVLIAAQDLPELTLVDSNSVATKKVLRSRAPLGYVSDPVEVISKILLRPVKQGEAFTKDCFAGKDSPIGLLSAIPKGKRAVTVSLTEYGGQRYLLSAGSVVDVLTSFRVPREDYRGEEVISITLLRGIQVFAVRGQTVMSSSTERPPGADVHTSEMQQVALLVTSKQAEQLQIAQKYGELSLSLRNPMEPIVEEDSSTLLSQVIATIQRRSAGMPVARTGALPTVGRPADWTIMFIRGGASELESVSAPQETQER